MIRKSLDILSTLAFLLVGAQIVWAVDTSLLFVGEDLSVVTIASRRAESPEKAPAVVNVITREDLECHGVRTLGEALSMLPGFYISPKEWGSRPFLRGASNSILFLYDSVPLTSDSTKSVHPLDEELSLAPIERIEVIRGPGSVLWGPDAFAGIVNIVPRRGRDLEGLELKTRLGTPDHEKSASISWGHNAGLWEGFLSVSANKIKPLEDKYNIVRLVGDESTPVSPDKRFGHSKIDESEYLEAVLNFSWQDWLHMSGRWSNADRPYVLKHPEKDLKWAGKRESPFRFVRIEMERPLEHSDIRLNAYYNELDYREEEIDRSWKQKSHVSYAEILYDRELWDAKGLFTLGMSYRYNRITGAVIEHPFDPDILDDIYDFFTPPIKQEDFNTSLPSFFGQVRHHWNHLDAWLGLRLDDHSQYSRTISHNMGIRWFPRSSWYVKLLHGTAYRTPYNKEFVGKTDLDPERVQDFSVNVVWNPHPSFTCSATTFWNEIRHHIQEDPYGGLSDPGSEDIYGLELDLNWQLSQSLRFQTNATFLSQNGDNERYSVPFYYLNPDDGTLVEGKKVWEVPFDTGPRNLFNARLLWNPLDRMDFSVRLQYADSRTIYYQKGEMRYSTTPAWIFDTTVTVRDVMFQGLDFQLALKNVFDRHYEVPGTYSPIKAAPFEAYFGLKWHY